METPDKGSGLEAKAAQAFIAGMKAEGARRLIVISAMGAGESAEQAGFFYGELLIPTMMRGVVKDKTHMEEEGDGTDFTSVAERRAGSSPTKGISAEFNSGFGRQSLGGIAADFPAVNTI